MAHPASLRARAPDPAAEAERSSVGAVFFDAARAVPVCRELGLEGGHFSLPLVGRVYAAALQAYDEAGVVEAVSLASRMAGDRELEALGGFSFLVELSGEVATAGNVRVHVELVLKAARKRRQIQALDAARRHVEAGDEPGTDLLEALLPAGNGRAPAFRWVAAIEPQSVEWLWYPYMPLGHVTLLDGDPGCGKSYLTCALAAGVSRGVLPGDTRPTRDPARTLICTAEDDAATTVVPRLLGMDADPEHIAVRDTVLTLDAEGVVELDRLTGEVKPDLLILDTLTAYMGASVDMHRANETRGLFAALRALAARHSCAVVPLRHLNKAVGGKAIYRGLGSIDIIAAARSCLLAGGDPDQPNQRALVHTKSNLAAPGEALGYEIGQDGRFSWTGESGLTAGQILGAGAPEEEAPARVEAEEFLREELADGPRLARDMERSAAAAGITKRTLQRARRAVCRTCKSGMGGGWVWELDVPEGAEGVKPKPLAPSGFVAPSGGDTTAQEGTL